jgi:ABC-type phosphate/phosphonate transport system substrate-binding protein
MNRCMWRKCTAAIAAAGLLTLIALNLTPAAAGRSEPASVRIGLVKTLFRDVPALLIPIGLRPMKALMESQTGVGGDLMPSGDYDKLARQLKDDEVQLGVFHGVEFAWAHEKYPTLKPLVIIVNGPAYLRAHLVVRADSKIASGANLKGKIVELPRMSSEHCRQFLEHRCCPTGELPEKFFAQVIGSSNAADALDDVVDDDAQGVVVDEVVYEAYQKSKPGRAAKLKTVQQSEAFPCAVMAYQPGVLSDRILDAFRDGLIAAKENPKAQTLLKANRVTGFEAVPSGYEKSLRDIAKAYPPPSAE